MHRRLLLHLALALVVTGSAIAQERPTQPIGVPNIDPSANFGTLSAAPATLDEILGCLLGPDVTVTGATLTGAADAAGLFTGGGPVLGFADGVVLGTGNVSLVAGPNTSDSAGQDNGFPGDPDLDALIPGFSTFDATVLSFDFECQDVTTVSFSYVFASDEYNEYVDTEFNDVFAFFLNGTAMANNIATVPATCSDPGIPVAINNVNCQNPYAPPLGLNCNCFRNNDLSDGGGTIATEMDGLTEVFFATAVVNPGVNSIKIAIADAGDGVLDSNVFIKCESFTCGEPTPTGACCLPQTGDCIVTTAGDCAAAGGSYGGDGTLCDPDPCGSTPTEQRSWGEIKSTYK